MQLLPRFAPARVIRLGFSAAALAIFAGCTTGPMDIQNVHYYAVKNRENTNYYRLRITAHTQLGIAGYREGWFPATAVDKLFGDVSASGDSSTSAAKDTIRKAYDDAVTAATKAYLDLAVNPDTPADKLKAAYEARIKVLTFPNTFNPVFPPGSGEIAYDADRGVAVPHSDEKLVIILSSDPDGVVGSIAAVAQDEKTAQTINNLGALMSQRSRADQAAAGARNDVQKQQVYAIRQAVVTAEKAVRPDAPATAPTGDALRTALATQVRILSNTLDLAAP